MDHRSQQQLQTGQIETKLGQIDTEYHTPQTFQDQCQYILANLLKTYFKSPRFVSRGEKSGLFLNQTGNHV